MRHLLLIGVVLLGWEATAGLRASLWHATSGLQAAVGALAWHMADLVVPRAMLHPWVDAADGRVLLGALLLLALGASLLRLPANPALRGLTWRRPPPDGLLLGRLASPLPFLRPWVALPPAPHGTAVDTLLLVGSPHRDLADHQITQLLTWSGSAIVSDPTDALYTATAGWRRTLGPVWVLDCRGWGHRFDPLGWCTDGSMLQQAAAVLLSGSERATAQRATRMLTVLFAAAQQEGMPILPYVGWCLRAGQVAAAARVGRLQPAWQHILLGEGQATPRALAEAWETLYRALRLLTADDVAATFAGRDVDPTDLFLGVGTLYVRGSTRFQMGWAPFVRLLWAALLGELRAWPVAHPHAPLTPILAMIDATDTGPIVPLPQGLPRADALALRLLVSVPDRAQLGAADGQQSATAPLDSQSSALHFWPTTTAEEAGTGSARQSVAFVAGHPPLLVDRADWHEESFLRRRQGRPTPTLRRVPTLASTLLTPQRLDGEPTRQSRGVTDATSIPRTQAPDVPAPEPPPTNGHITERGLIAGLD